MVEWGISAVDISSIRRDYFAAEMYSLTDDDRYQPCSVKTLSETYRISEKRVWEIILFQYRPNIDDFVMLVNMFSAHCKEIYESEQFRNRIITTICKRHKEVAEYYIQNLQNIMIRVEKFAYEAAM